MINNVDCLFTSIKTTALINIPAILILKAQSSVAPRRAPSVECKEQEQKPNILISRNLNILFGKSYTIGHKQSFQTLL